jgi:hypothetical protein
MIDEAKIAKLSLERVGGQVSRLMNSSSKVNRFLNRENKIPTAIKELGKWIELQTSGVANVEDISKLIAIACARTIKTEVDKVTEEFAAMQLTDDQIAKLPGAIEAYEKFLIELVSKLKRVDSAINVEETIKDVKPKAETAAKPKAKASEVA